MSIELDLNTGAVKEKGIHVGLSDDGKGVMVQPVNTLLAQELNTQVDQERSEAIKRFAASLEREVSSLTREEIEQSNKRFRFSPALAERMATALMDCIVGFDDGFITSGGRSVNIEDTIGESEQTALEVIAGYWSERRPVWCMKIIGEAGEYGAEVQGNLPGASSSSGDTEEEEETARPRLTAPPDPSPETPPTPEPVAVSSSPEEGD